MDSILGKVIKTDQSIRVNRGKVAIIAEEVEGYAIDIDISEAEVIGVVGRYVYCLIQGYKVLITGTIDHEDEVSVEWVFRCTINEYLGLQKKWLLGKREKCEAYNMFCGVMGYMYADEWKCIGSIQVHGYKEIGKEIEQYYRDLPTFTVQKWANEEPDFERG